MLTLKSTQKSAYFRRWLSGLICFFFISTAICPVEAVAQTVFNLPAPGAVITLSQPFTPPLVRGITLYPDNPLKFDFIVDVGDGHLTGDAFQKESMKLIKYFLVSLTVPENDMWVNLSPYEKDRIIPEHFGRTEMGRDLLLQDYMLKQLTASLMNPEQELGAKFWDRVRAKAKEKFGVTDIPTDTFSKVWIIPDKAQVYVKGQSVFVVESHLKVMMEEDYLASQQDNVLQRKSLVTNENKSDPRDDFNRRQSLNQIVKEIIIPAIEIEVNEGKNFALLRQIQNSAILAAWYKKNLKETLLGKVYVDQKKTDSMGIGDQQAAERIYGQYLEAFKKGVYNYIKDDYDPLTQEVTSRKYFSGGITPIQQITVADSAALAETKLAQNTNSVSVINVALENVQTSDQAMVEDEDITFVAQSFNEIVALYDESNNFENQRVDLTPIIGPGALGTGKIPTGFPLPNGTRWADQGSQQTAYFRVGRQLSRIEMIVHKKKGKVQAVTFIGYRKSEGQKEDIEYDRSYFVWTRESFVYQSPQVAFLESIHDAYSSKDKREEIKIDISEFLGEAALQRGETKFIFPLPNGQSWGRPVQHLRIGKDLSKVDFIIHKTKGKVTSVTFIGYKKLSLSSSELVEIGRSQWKWTGETFEYIEGIDPIVEAIKELYGPYDFQEKRINITDFLGESPLTQGHIRKAFPLPNGEVWGGNTESMKVNIKLSRVDLIVHKKEGKVKGITFVGYKTNKRGENQQRESYWKWTGKKFEYVPTDIGKKKILDLYDPKDLFDEKTIDISEYMGLKTLKNGHQKNSFPLPNGKSWGTEGGPLLRIGVRLSRMELTVKKKDGLVTAIVFIGYKEDANGREFESMRSNWNWSGEKFNYFAQIHPIEEAWESLRESKEDKDIPIGSIIEFIGEGAGVLQGSFPSPDGGTIGHNNRMTFGIGGARSASATLIKRGSRLGMIVEYSRFSKGKERTGALTLYWDPIEKKFLTQKNILIQKVVDAYRKIHSGLDTQVDIGNINELVTLTAGTLSASFPDLKGKPLNKQMGLGIGRPLKNVKLKIGKENEKITLLIEAVQESGREYSNKIYLDGNINDIVLLPEKKVEVESKECTRNDIEALFDPSNKFDERRIDISNFVGISLESGRRKTGFPLPNGKNWGTADRGGFLNIGVKLLRIELIVRKIEGNVKTVTFIGYRNSKRLGREIINESH